MMTINTNDGKKMVIEDNGKMTANDSMMKEILDNIEDPDKKENYKPEIGKEMIQNG